MLFLSQHKSTLIDLTIIFQKFCNLFIFLPVPLLKRSRHVNKCSSDFLLYCKWNTIKYFNLRDTYFWTPFGQEHYCRRTFQIPTTHLTSTPTECTRTWGLYSRTSYTTLYTRSSYWQVRLLVLYIYITYWQLSHWLLHLRSS